MTLCIHKQLLCQWEFKACTQELFGCLQRPGSANIEGPLKYVCKYGRNTECICAMWTQDVNAAINMLYTLLAWIGELQRAAVWRSGDWDAKLAIGMPNWRLGCQIGSTQARSDCRCLWATLLSLPMSRVLSHLAWFAPMKGANSHLLYSPAGLKIGLLTPK